jgi:hypothetical protein
LLVRKFSRQFSGNSSSVGQRIGTPGLQLLTWGQSLGRTTSVTPGS